MQGKMNVKGNEVCKVYNEKNTLNMMPTVCSVLSYLILLMGNTEQRHIIALTGK